MRYACIFDACIFDEVPHGHLISGPITEYCAKKKVKIKQMQSHTEITRGTSPLRKKKKSCNVAEVPDNMSKAEQACSRELFTTVKYEAFKRRKPLT